MPQNPTWFTYEDESEVRERDWLIRPGDVVLDVGAEFGSYTVTALSQGASFVWAWSPQGFRGRPAVDYLMETLRLNGWEDKCRVLTSGAHNKTGWLNTHYRSFTYEDPGESEDVIRVEPLDVWFERERPSRVDWLKIDVEGSEVEVLKGAAYLISLMKPTVLVENHTFIRGSLRGEVEAVLAGMGYGHVHTFPHHGVSHSMYKASYGAGG